MAKYINVMIILGAFMAVFLQSVAAQTTTTVHIVGDSVGWRIPPTGGAAFYENWAAKSKFVVGDTLTFNFTTGIHDVVEVPKASYDACTSTGSIGPKRTNGPANITLSTPGDHYYICDIDGHCNAGQKLHITVSTSSDAASPHAGGPATPPATPGGPSSSSIVIASFFLSMMSIFIGLSI